MAKTKVTFIICYFGKFPNYIDLFLRSCSINTNYNWLIFTDNKQYPHGIASNTEFISMEFKDLQARIRKKINEKCICPTPYKICDYRPAFGTIFSEYLHNSEYWGFCDLDMLFGNLDKYLSGPIADKYDAIYNHGHLTLMHNIPEVNKAFMLPFSGIEYKYVFSHKASFGFDEKRGINQILKEYGFNTYQEDTFADIYPPEISIPLKLINKINYADQIFTWEEGKICRIIQSNNEQTEYSYIHLQKRPFTRHNPDLLKVKSFYIHPFSFDEKKTDHLSLTQGQIKTIKKSKIKNLRSSLIYKYHLVINWILYNKKPVKRQY